MGSMISRSSWMNKGGSPAGCTSIQVYHDAGHVPSAPMVQPSALPHLRKLPFSFFHRHRFFRPRGNRKYTSSKRLHVIRTGLGLWIMSEASSPSAQMDFITASCSEGLKTRILMPRKNPGLLGSLDHNCPCLHGSKPDLKAASYVVGQTYMCLHG